MIALNQIHGEEGALGSARGTTLLLALVGALSGARPTGAADAPGPHAWQRWEHAIAWTLHHYHHEPHKPAIHLEARHGAQGAKSWRAVDALSLGRHGWLSGIEIKGTRRSAPPVEGVWVLLQRQAVRDSPKRSMVFPGKDWPAASAESQGMDSAKLKAAVDYLAHKLSEYGGAGTLFMVRNGYVLWAGPECDREYQIYSGTKSFTSTVLGLLIDDGKVTLNTLAKDLEPALAAGYPAVRLRHFATMTSGYDSAGGSYEFDGQKRGDSWNPGPPAAPLFPPGTRFRYWDDAMSQFGSLLTKAAGEPLDRVFKRRIADPIGMTQWRWMQNDSPVGPVLSWTGGIHTSSRELARFGHLFLNRGKWNGRQLVSASWVDQATSVQVPVSIRNDDLPRSRGAGIYGYNWWVNGLKPDGRRLWPGAPPRTFYANGLHNNVCIVIPEWNLVVARTNGGRKDGSANGPPDVDAIWSGFFARLDEALR